MSISQNHRTKLSNEILSVRSRRSIQEAENAANDNHECEQDQSTNTDMDGDSTSAYYGDSSADSRPCLPCENCDHRR